MNIVITGSTAGIGLAFAIKFLEFGDKVIISSRTLEKVNLISSKLKIKFGNDYVLGIVCDVSKPSDVMNLAEKSVEFFQKIDFWINNAGTNYNTNLHLIENSNEMLTSIVNTNLLGTLFGCREALRIMIKQNYGHIINVAGRGTNGESSENILAYGATKRSLDSIHKSLQKELKQTNIGIHLVSPGMVLTDLLIRENTPIKTKKIFNILAEHPTYVAMKLVPKIRNLHGSGKKISFLDNKKAFFRFITAFRYKNKFFDSNGNLKVNINPVDKI